MNMTRKGWIVPVLAAAAMCWGSSGAGPARQRRLPRRQRHTVVEGWPRRRRRVAREGRRAQDGFGAVAVARTSATNSANAGVAGQRWPLLRNRKSLKTRRPASPTAGRVRLEGCCSIHLSYGRDVTAEELNARVLLVYGVRSDPRRLSLPSRSR